MGPPRVSVLAVKGNARTAKMEAMRHVRRYYREKLVPLLKKNGGEGSAARGRKEIDRVCRAMEETLDVLVNIDY